MRTIFLIVFAVIAAVALTVFRLRSNAPAEEVHHMQGAAPAKHVDVADIARRADDIPPPITRNTSERVVFTLETKEVVAEVSPGTTYGYWTYNGTVPGPMLRVREGDTVEIRLTHTMHGHAGLDDNIPPFAIVPAAFANGEDTHTNMGTDEHAAAGHGTHSIDLHAVIGPGGGATLMQVKSGETRAFEFTATRPGLYVYHCASPHIPTHIANGMYGMILVEPASGMSKVDREFYIMQGELYTQGHVGQKGHQEFSKEKLLAEQPEYVIFNGRMGALAGNGALKAKTGEKIRLFVGVGTFLASNFHVIGGVLDYLYPEGDLISLPHRNVQTTLIPAGGAVMVELTLDVPGKYLIVDHSLARAIDRGAVGEIVVEGKDRPDLFREVK